MTETAPRAPRRIVQDGYEAVAERYLDERKKDIRDVGFVQAALARLPDGAAVLDAGCGAGVPVTCMLAERFRATGVDISARQVALARKLVPEASFIEADITRARLPDGTFDAIVSLYTIFHIPRAEHAELLAHYRRLLRPNGLLVASFGTRDDPASIEDDWLGAGGSMYWSSHDRATNLGLVRDAGFHILKDTDVSEEVSPQGPRHLFIQARRTECLGRPS